MPGRRFRVTSTKYDGSPHYAYDAWLVDEIGPCLRLLVPSGTWLEGYRGAFPTQVPFTALFFTDGRWFNCYHNHWTTPRFSIESYANVSLPAERHGDEVRWVDLDLDVLTRRGRAPEIVDQDEFAAHRERFRYPDDLVRSAQAAAEDLLEGARAGAAPWDRAAHLDAVPAGWRLAAPDDAQRDLLRAAWTERWGAPRVASRGRLHELDALPAVVAHDDEGGGPAAVATYRIDGEACEVVSLDALRPGTGVGGVVLDAVVRRATAAGCRRAWLVTTNDNLRALDFYQRRGWRIVAVHRDAVSRARAELKPEIPRLGAGGVALRDEIEVELVLGPAR